MNNLSILRRLLQTKLVLNKKFLSIKVKENKVKNFQNSFRKKINNSISIKKKTQIDYAMELFYIKSNKKINFYHDLHNINLGGKKLTPLLAIFLIFFSESKKNFILNRFYKKFDKNNSFKEFLRIQIIFFKKIFEYAGKVFKMNKFIINMNRIFKKILTFIYIVKFFDFHFILQLVFKETFVCEKFRKILIFIIFFLKKKSLKKEFFSFFFLNKAFYSHYPTIETTKNILYSYTFFPLNDISLSFLENFSDFEIFSNSFLYENRNQIQFLELINHGL